MMSPPKVWRQHYNESWCCIAAGGVTRSSRDPGMLDWPLLSNGCKVCHQGWLAGFEWYGPELLWLLQWLAVINWDHQEMIWSLELGWDHPQEKGEDVLNIETFPPRQLHWRFGAARIQGMVGTRNSAKGNFMQLCWTVLFQSWKMWLSVPNFSENQ